MNVIGVYDMNRSFDIERGLFIWTVGGYLCLS